MFSRVLGPTGWIAEVREGQFVEVSRSRREIVRPPRHRLGEHWANVTVELEMQVVAAGGHADHPRQPREHSGIGRSAEMQDSHAVRSVEVERLNPLPRADRP